MRFLIVIYMFSLVTLLQGQNNEIEWTSNYRLVYDDFKGGIPGNEPKTTKALTYSVIDLDVKQVGQEIHTYIRTYFKYYNSWMRPESRTDYTLKHEQGHFDITEIYSRKLRKKLMGLKVKRKGGDKQILSIAKKLIKQHLKYQAKYDKDTGFAIKEKNQAEWIIKIAKELKELEAYKEATVKMQFK
jgi:hypothetical protein